MPKETAIRVVRPDRSESIVAFHDVPPLVARDAERRELGTAIGVMNIRKLSDALLVGFQSVFGFVGFFDHHASKRRSRNAGAVRAVRYSVRLVRSIAWSSGVKLRAVTSLDNLRRSSCITGTKSRNASTNSDSS
jgi:hypothetical protein